MGIKQLLNSIKYIPLTVFLLIPLVFWAQMPGMKVYTQLDGYPATIGYVMHQDEKGFIWMGTNNGAVCFDGKKFKVIDDRMGLIDKEILIAVPFKDDHAVLVPLLNNISYYKNGKVFTAKEDARLKIFDNRTANKWCFDEVTNKCWISDGINDSSLYCLWDNNIIKKTIKIKHLFSPIKIKNDVMITWQPDWKGSYYGRYDIKTEKFDSIIYMEPREQAQAEFSAVSDDLKYIAIYNKMIKKIVICEIVDNKWIKRIGEVNTEKTRKGLYVTIDRNNDLWLSLVDGGIEYWGNICKINSKSEAVFVLPDIVVNHVLVDKENNKWFSTKNKGLLFISEKHWHNALAVQKLKLPDYIPLSIEKGPENNIYIGYNTSAYSVIKDGKAELKMLDKRFMQGAQIIKNINKKIYFAGASSLYSVKNTQGRRALRYSFKDINAYGLDKLAVATHIGIYIVDPNNYDYDNIIEIFFGRTTCVTQLPNNDLFIGTPNGLYIKKDINKPAEKIKDPLLSQAHITDFTLAAHDYVLIGTSVLGLFTYNYKTGIVRHISTNNERGTSLIREIFRQNDSVYWLATDRGVYKVLFDRFFNEREFESYTFFDGLPSSNTTDVYVQNDTMYVATSLGLGILVLNDALANVRKPPINWITSARVGDKTYSFPTKLHLTHKQNDIQVSLSSISYESVGNIKYLYKLEGLSDKWIETESPDISFSALPPGNYKLWVNAINFKGVKGIMPAMLPIIIEPAFWQTNWFKVLLWILFLLIAILIIYRFIITEKNKQYNKIQQQRRLAELELEAIKAQINPHFIYNCLNSIQYFSYKNDYEPVNQYLELFAKLIRQTMQYSQETFISLDEEVDYLSNYLQLEKVRFKEKLNYKLDIEKGILGTTLIPSMLIQPYVENALKHGIAKGEKVIGEVQVTIKKAADGWLCICVEDNGPGLKGKPIGTVKEHLGMRLSGSRAATYNQLFDLTIKINITANNTDTNGTIGGVRVELLIPPIKQEHTRF